MSSLRVWWQRDWVGTISLSRGERMEFRYTPEWLGNQAAFPISLSLPLRAEVFGEQAHSFFANLLPEADVRVRLCQRLKVTPGNDFELLRLIGGECAGALTVADEPPADQFSQDDYRPIELEQLRLWSLATTPDAFSSTVGRDGVRLSLAGAQDKLPVRLTGKQVSLPLGQAPSTHLLKFASPHFKYLPENEFFLGLVAGQLGLPVPLAELWRVENGGTILVVERYDRRLEDGRIVRLHQEDFCQALGRSPLRKYQKEGGPRPGELAAVIREHDSLPLIDLQLLLRWGLFNWLFGNSDAHAKNASLLLSPTGGIRLAPFYDLVCTRIYKSLDRHLAMSLGEQFDPGQVLHRDLEAYARELQVAPRLVWKVAEELLEGAEEAVARAAQLFSQRVGESPVVEMVRLQVIKNVKRARNTTRQA
jgi:serine/threonine-protein kinase HipA